MSDVGRWRRIYSGDWYKSAFRGLTDAERVVYFYAKTGPQSTSVGIYRMSTAVAVEDLSNLSPVEFDFRLDVVCQACEWRFDPPTRVLWMPSWLAENPPQSPNVCVSWRKLLANLPDCDLKFEAVAAVSDVLKDMPKAFRDSFGSLPKDPRNSKAKTQPKTQANQGSGDSGIQGFREQRAGTPAKDGNDKNDLLPFAREALKLNARGAPTDVLVDSFQVLIKPKTSTKSEGFRLINLAQSEAHHHD